MVCFFRFYWCSLERYYFDFAGLFFRVVCCVLVCLIWLINVCGFRVGAFCFLVVCFRFEWICFICVHFFGLGGLHVMGFACGFGLWWVCCVCVMNYL